MNCLTSSLFRDKAPSFSGNGWTLFTLVGLFPALVNMQDSQAGTAQFFAEGNLGLTIGGNTDLLPFGSSHVRGLINS